MIKIKQVDVIPADLLEAVNKFYKHGSSEKLEKFFALSRERLYLEDEHNRPLLLIGAFSLSLFSPSKELWMVGSKYLRLEHVILGKTLLWKWVEEQTCAVYARAETESAARFLRFVGFTQIGLENGAVKFEARL